ncbi:MAG: hypothetical protein LUI06_10335 [Ruminococcus sp.]|nr:hypothetical protein [Ruminococcus sp.]
MQSAFLTKEKQSFLLKKHIKERLPEYAIEIIIDIVFVLLILKLCNGENVALAIALAVVCALGKITADIFGYRKKLKNKE